MMRLHFPSLIFVIGLFLGAQIVPVLAAQSEVHSTDAFSARLITAQQGVEPDTSRLSAGLFLELKDKWKTYWRSAGQVGTPPSIDWTGSTNVKSVNFHWPAPKRFKAFGIENFGYEGDIVFPLEILLLEKGKRTVLRGKVDLLVCSSVCVPQTFDLSLKLNQNSGVDKASADLISEFLGKTPDDGVLSGLEFLSASINENTDELVVSVSSSTPLVDPDVFPEFGEDGVFGAPDIRIDETRLWMWASLPLLSKPKSNSDLSLTVVDKDRASTFQAELTSIPSEPPYELKQGVVSVSSYFAMILIAYLGGVILNVMPCVLPVLSIKLNSIINSNEMPNFRIRAGFLASAAGIVAFMLLLAIVLIAMRTAGLTVSWGTQFQDPLFVSLLAIMLAVFSANMLGLFEIVLPSKLQSQLSENAPTGGYVGDFSSGALVAVLATPCSAPFVGTAVAFALASNSFGIVLIFSFLGLGLATPYLLIAAFPPLISAFPKPGRWMVLVKMVLAVALSGTVIWLFWVLTRTSSPALATSVGVFTSFLIFSIFVWQRQQKTWVRYGSAVITVFLGVAVPISGLADIDTASDKAPDVSEAIRWQKFSLKDIPGHIAQGKTVFVDVTADWCISCKANKALALDRDQVVNALNDSNMVAMLADWTQPNEEIASYLQQNGRFGIPFNIVYGPFAPDGIILSEFLTAEKVLLAIEEANSSR